MSLTWRIEFAQSAARDIKKLDPPIARRLTSFLRERSAPLADARAVGQALKGDELGQFWKYRVGDYRLIVEIHDSHLRILVVRLGHRRDVYR
jgi:mRNA interferase RelE/StbE